MRQFKANNKYMEDFDKCQPSVFRAFFDATSLYAGTIQQPLPGGNYKWRNDLTIVDLLNADCFGDVGYFVEVDLEYLPHLHDQHNDLPLAAEKLQTKTEWLSDYAKSFGIPASRVAKLVEILFVKNFHFCHFRILKFYVEKGLTVKCLHRVLHQHQLFVTQINKIVMSAFDDKRFVVEVGIQSFAYGHYSLEQTSTFCNVLFGSTEFSLEH